MIPCVEEEFETIRTIIRRKVSIARFGDGELRNALGGSCKIQNSHPVLAEKLKKILRNEISDKLLIGIPRSVGRFDLWRWDSKKMIGWQSFEREKFVNLLGHGPFYSSFITRPDSAFHIDCDQYWNMIKEIWRNRKITVLTGDGKFRNNLDLFNTAKAVNFVNKFPSQHAFFAHDEIMSFALKIPRDNLIILALGPEATVAAYELTLAGYQALDLGHIEMFYRRNQFRRDELITKDHITENKMLHASPKGMGTRGFKWAEAVVFLAREWRIGTILDYGCGTGTLKEEVLSIMHKGLTVYEYDPAIKEKSQIPKNPVEMVVCTDVLEHVEPSMLDNVLDHINFLVGKIGFFVISTVSTAKTLSTGQSAHLTVQPADWWIDRIIKDRKWKSVEVIPSSVFCRDSEKEVAILVTK